MAEFVPPTPEKLNLHFPHYEITDFIAKGGMGAVYRARQISLDRPVAIKILPPELGNDRAYLASFESEAKSLAKLNHSNLVGIYDFGVIHNLYFIIMEYVPGRSLYYAAHGHSVDEQEAAFLISEICKGLAHAHEHGILHRDIKPANILIDDEARPMLVDFGLAKPVADHRHEGVTFGTVGYTAPEVVHSPHLVDQRSDIYSVGIMLYELLTSQIPGEPFIPASQKNNTDPRFDLIIQKATHPQITQRYRSCSEMARELDELLQHWDQPPSHGTKILETAANANSQSSAPLLMAAPGSAAAARANANAAAQKNIAAKFQSAANLPKTGMHHSSLSSSKTAAAIRQSTSQSKGGLVVITLLIGAILGGGLVILNKTQLEPTTNAETIADLPSETPEEASNTPLPPLQPKPETSSEISQNIPKTVENSPTGSATSDGQSAIDPPRENQRNNKKNRKKKAQASKKPAPSPAKTVKNGPSAIDFNVVQFLDRGKKSVQTRMAENKRKLDENLIRNISQLGRAAEEQAQRLPRKPRLEALEVVREVIQTLRRQQVLPTEPPSDANVFILENYPNALTKQNDALQQYQKSLAEFHARYLEGIERKIQQLETTENYIEVKHLKSELTKLNDIDAFRELIF